MACGALVERGMNVPTASNSASTLGTLAGFAAIINWALLALFTTGATGLPPFQLLAMTFAIAAVLGTAVSLARGRLGGAALRQPVGAWALGILGLYGYHACYFIALKNAPPAEASLIAYLWPLLIVLFSALLPGERLRWFHVVGALMGFAGAGLLIGGEGLFGGGFAIATGHWVALACALIWSTYSVSNRRYGAVPTDIVGPQCGAVAVLGWLTHLAVENTATPDGLGWLAVLGLGLGPVGAAFFLWDYGVKRGRIQLIGVLSYAAPLISTILLVVFGLAAATATLAVACLLIVAGALIASLDLLPLRPKAAARSG